MRSFARANTARRCQRAFTMGELIVAIVIIAIISMLAIPIIRGINHVSESKTRRNAQMTADVSSNLSSLNVVHVLPEALGGAEATTRLLRLGITVPDGPMQGAYMGVPNLPEGEIEATSKYLRVVVDNDMLRLEYTGTSAE